MEQTVEQSRRKAFPPRLAVVKPNGQYGFEARFLRQETLSNVGPNTSVGKGVLDTMNTIIKEGSGDLLLVVTHSSVHDAILIRRPYARIIEGDSDVRGILRFRIDGEKVAEGEIRSFLVKDLDDPILDEPFKWASNHYLFTSGLLRDNDEVVVMENPPSIFAPTESQLLVSVTDVCKSDGKPARLEVGFLAATYTTDFSAHKSVER